MTDGIANFEHVNFSADGQAVSGASSYLRSVPSKPVSQEPVLKIRSARFSRSSGRIMIVLSNNFEFMVKPDDFEELRGYESHLLIGIGPSEDGEAIELLSVDFRLNLGDLLDRCLGKGNMRRFIGL